MLPYDQDVSHILSEENMEIQQKRIIEAINNIQESCIFKSILSGGTGFVIGSVFGLFMSSISMDISVDHKIYDKSFKEQLKYGFKDMGKRSWLSAKNFATVGAIFSGSECCIESYRAKNDIYNGISAGCFTGGALTIKSGPKAMAIGCLGFSAFSAVIDYYLRSN
ncbi:hypothetical protein PNEG_01495 [Pneumocystis murina B123]|uniref:Mitochondrial import inner membrane translocase subunit TIM22 n=1 Tax=Pneumocystis murina (strain B123) TaxID=1069680 RepID=M7NNF7_PNEMU|nr:hypothetical protein PNEG_01495 [Pneumocystis murina B123]EMR10223.1 hypothetical protein PNEG_01495 [Pneumocystis murina B123]